MDGSARRQTTGVAVLRRGFVDDERTAQMCEDGWLNLSVIPLVREDLAWVRKKQKKRKI